MTSQQELGQILGPPFQSFELNPSQNNPTIDPNLKVPRDETFFFFRLYSPQNHSIKYWKFVSQSITALPLEIALNGHTILLKISLSNLLMLPYLTSKILKQCNIHLKLEEILELNLKDRLKLFLSKVFNNILPIRSLLKRIMPLEDDQVFCPLCQIEEENFSHLFFNYTFSSILWRHSKWRINIYHFAS